MQISLLATALVLLPIMLSACGRSGPETQVVPSTRVDSDDGRITATLKGRHLGLQHADGREQTLELPLEKTTPYFLYFTVSNELRAYPQQRFEHTTANHPQVDDVWTIKPFANTAPTRCSIESPSPGLFLRPSSDGSRLIALEKQRSVVTIYSGDGCSKVAVLESTGKLRSAMFTRDGGIAGIFASEAGCVLMLFDSKGVLRWSTPVAGNGSDAYVQTGLLSEYLFFGIADELRTSPSWESSWHLAFVLDGQVTPLEATATCAPEEAFHFWSASKLSSPSDRVKLKCGSTTRLVQLPIGGDAVPTR